MDPVIVSAQFAAYVWYTKHVPKALETDAVTFAKENWSDFVSLAHVGLGRLLIKIAAKHSKRIYHIKLSNLKVLAKALRQQRGSRAG